MKNDVIWPPINNIKQNCKFCELSYKSFCTLFGLLEHKDRINLLRTSWSIYTESAKYIKIYYERQYDDEYYRDNKGETCVKKNISTNILPQLYYPYREIVLTNYPLSFDIFDNFVMTTEVTVMHCDDEIKGVISGIEKSFPNIKQLTIDFRGRYDDDYNSKTENILKDVEELSNIGNMQGLEELTFILCNVENYKINDDVESIAYIFKEIKGLKKLKYLKIDISHCDMFNSELKIILEFVKRCSNLLVLDLNLESNEITEKGIKYFEMLKGSKVEHMVLNLSYNAFNKKGMFYDRKDIPDLNIFRDLLNFLYLDLTIYMITKKFKLINLANSILI